MGQEHPRYGVPRPQASHDAAVAADESSFYCGVQIMTTERQSRRVRVASVLILGSAACHTHDANRAGQVPYTTHLRYAGEPPLKQPCYSAESKWARITAVSLVC